MREKYCCFKRVLSVWCSAELETQLVGTLEKDFAFLLLTAVNAVQAGGDMKFLGFSMATCFIGGSMLLVVWALT